jgi:hypothetical protein
MLYSCYAEQDIFEKLLNEAMEDGEETNIHIANYWKFIFTITFNTDHARWVIEVGGDANDIFKLDPYGGWSEWQAAGITRISKLMDYSPPKSK